MDLVCEMTNLSKLEMLMFSLIFSAFCSNKKCLLFFDFNNLTRLIRTPPMEPSLSVLTGFDCIIYIYTTT